MTQEQLNDIFNQYLRVLRNRNVVDEAGRLALLGELLNKPGVMVRPPRVRSVEFHVAVAAIALGPLLPIGPVKAGAPPSFISIPLSVFQTIQNHCSITALILHRNRVAHLRQESSELDRRRLYARWLALELTPTVAMSAESGAIIRRSVLEVLRCEEIIGTTKDKRCRQGLEEALVNVNKNPVTQSTVVALLKLIDEPLGELLDNNRRLFEWIADDDPAVSTAVWFGRGGDLGRKEGRNDFKTGWEAEWPIPGLWLETQARAACNFVDPILKQWARLGQPAPAAGGVEVIEERRLAADDLHDMMLTDDLVDAFDPPDLVNGVVIRFAKRHMETHDITDHEPLTFEYRPVPVGYMDLTSHIEDPGYGPQWTDAGASVFRGDQQIATLRPGARYVFRTGARSLQGPPGKVLPPSDRIVARCDDRRMDITGDEGARLDPSRPCITFTPHEDASSIIVSACACGTLHCEERHNICGWQPKADPHVSLKDYIWNAVKGPMAVVKSSTAASKEDVKKVAAESFRGSMYYALLTSETKLRHGEMRIWKCIDCNRRAQRRAEIRHLRPGCGDRLRQVHVGVLFQREINTYALRAYWVNDQEELVAEVNEASIFGHPWLSAFSHFALCPEWPRLTRPEKLTWRNTLGFNDPAIQMLSASYNGDWIEEITAHMSGGNGKPAYKDIATAVTLWLATTHPNPTQLRQHIEQVIAQHIEQVIAYENPWAFLLIHGFPPELRMTSTCVPRNAYPGNWKADSAERRVEWLNYLATVSGRSAYEPFLDVQQRLKAGHMNNKKRPPSPVELWEAVEKAASNSPWLQLLLKGVPFGYVPRVPPTFLEQVNLLEEVVVASGVLVPGPAPAPVEHPQHFWAKEE